MQFLGFFRGEFKREGEGHKIQDVTDWFSLTQSQAQGGAMPALFWLPLKS